MKFLIDDLDKLGVAIIRAAINAAAMDVTVIEAEDGLRALHDLMDLHPEAGEKNGQLHDLVENLRG